jgi:choline dehydrogenase
MAGYEFDVVVVGGGSAGCAAAGRLCATTDLRVCLVEAGPDYGPVGEGYWPNDLLDIRVLPSSHDWGYVEERADGSTSPEPRAKVIGGCSAHNHCAAVWGMPEDYDRWAASGNTGWAHADLLGLIDQVEQCGQATSVHRGKHGALPTRLFSASELCAWQQAFLQTAEACGYPQLADLSFPDPSQGVAPLHVNVLDHTRWNAAFAFLDPVREFPTLTIRDQTLADRLLIDQESATELICRSGEGEIELAATMFILTAGAYGSPAILLRSGIGPSDHLADLTIPVVMEVPGVGGNLQEHPGVAVRFGPSAAARAAMEEERHRGALFHSQVILRAGSSRAAGGFDLHLLPYLFESQSGSLELMMLAYDMVPRSRGRVRLRSEDPEQAPLIERQFLTDPDDGDMAALVDGFNLIRQLAATEPLASSIAAEVDPGPRVRQLADLHAFIRSTVEGYEHPGGTCKMGSSTDPLAVVDATGRVHGTSNIYVADASIMPEIPRANTNLTCMLIGMKVADAAAAAVRDLR